MYDDVKPCEVCGSPVELEPRDRPAPADGGPVGPDGGYVGTADGPVDARVCTNPGCPSRTDDAQAP